MPKLLHSNFRNRPGSFRFNADPRSCPQRFFRKGFGYGRRSQEVRLVMLAAAIVTATLCSWSMHRSSGFESDLSQGIFALRQLDSELTGVCTVSDAVQQNRRPAYVFLHLHKTAGNNLKEALFGFAKKNKLQLYHTCRKSTADFAFYSWWLKHRKRAGIDYDCDLAEFAKMSYARRNSFDLIVGHQYLGVHVLMPERDVMYFTFVRDPLMRKVSHFEHFEVDGKGDRETNSPQNGDHDLWNYLTTRNRNYMVKRLSTTRFSSELVMNLRSKIVDTSATAANSALHQAEVSLVNKFFFVGIQERYSESLCVLATILNTACYDQRGINSVTGKAFNWRRAAKSKANSRSLAKRVIAKLPRDVYDKAIAVEFLDARIYTMASTLFTQKLSRYPQCREYQQER
jgi:hypothetical protein